MLERLAAPPVAAALCPSAEATIRQPTGIGRRGTRADLLLGHRRQPRRQGRVVATEDDQLGIDHIGQNGQAAAEVPAGRPQRLQHGRILGPRAPDEVVHLGLEVDGFDAGHRLDQRAHAGDGLEAAMPAARAGRAVRHHLNVSDLAAVAQAAAQQPTIRENAGTDPGVAVEVDQIGTPAYEPYLCSARTARLASLSIATG